MIVLMISSSLCLQITNQHWPKHLLLNLLLDLQPKLKYKEVQTKSNHYWYQQGVCYTVALPFTF
jgi:hypothetical protein